MDNAYYIFYELNAVFYDREVNIIAFQVVVVVIEENNL